MRLIHLPMNKKNKNKTSIINQSEKLQPPDHHLEERTQQYVGPIPPPSLLDEFNQIIPGAAERILRMAEENAKHQREIEMLALTSAVKTTTKGQIFGLIIGLSAFITTGFSLYLGFENAAMTIGGTTVIGLVTAFIKGRTQKNNDSK